jgi:hypothetical protein
MGSLTKSVKAPTPAPVQTVYVPAPAVSTPTPETPTDEQIKTQNRADNLLRRVRGTIGTVLTGFRGVLGLKNDTNAPTRKNLLGE